MSKFDLSTALKTLKTTMAKHSPEILTGIGIAGMVTTTILAVKVTPKAIDILREIKEEHKEDTDKKAMSKEVVTRVFPVYIPAAVTCVVSVACLVGASSVNARRNAALAAAYTLSDTALREYKEKVVETIGEKKERTIREEISKDRVKNDPVDTTKIIVTEKGNTRFYDAMTKRRFTSDLDHIRRIENELNRRMRDEYCISLNEFYIEVGLDTVPVGDILGWNIDRGYIEIQPDTMLDDDGVPCIIIDYLTRPSYDFE